MKKAIVMLLTAGLIATMTACGGTKTEETTNNAKTGTGTTNSDAYDVTVIIKATDSDYWQSVLLGAEAAAEESVRLISQQQDRHRKQMWMSRFLF
mgnify:CR=1 FL=1